MARDFKNTETDEHFAATPPWEMIKFLLSLFASQGGHRGDGGARGKTGGERREQRRSERALWGGEMETWIGEGGREVEG